MIEYWEILRPTIECSGWWFCFLFSVPLVKYGNITLQLGHDRFHTLFVSLLNPIPAFGQAVWVRAVDSIVKSSILWFIVVVVVVVNFVGLWH
jgi:hypothetical protein